MLTANPLIKMEFSVQKQMTRNLEDEYDTYFSLLYPTGLVIVDRQF